MSGFSWTDLWNGLDSGLDIVESVAAVVPGGQKVAVGAAALGVIVEKVNGTSTVGSAPITDEEVKSMITEKVNEKVSDVVSDTVDKASEALEEVGEPVTEVLVKINELSEPITTITNLLSAIVQAKNENKKVSITNEDILAILDIVAQSSGNDIDDRLVCLISGYITCEKGE